MKYNLIFRERAINEIQESFDYYENENFGLGDRFKSQLKKELDYILENPKHFKIVRKSFRQTMMSVFPFLIIYKISEENIIIYSVFHTSRNPKEKLKNK